MTIDQVRAKIRRNFGKSVATLEWVQLSKTTMQSSDKKFTIGKLPEGVEFRYEAFMGKTPIAFKLETFAEAKSLCEAHSRAQGQEPPLSRSPVPMSDQERLSACK